ncbi:MAG: penicillin-binding transpeptidase domain-containing protein, partial [bacterium]|nr:penicillin-binding transpeptidase domain-containing protein [bacterium]
AASVAAGHTVEPVLVLGVEDGAGEDVGAEEEAPAPDTGGLQPEEAEALSAMMRSVVESGTARMLRDVPGEPVHAKSGTAQWGSGETIHAWMIAFQGDLAVAAFIEGASVSGTADAGPLVRDLLTRLAP